MKTEYKKLPKKFKAKWIKALRSGEYKQGLSCLHHDSKYCCLGVACDISGIDMQYVGARGTIPISDSLFDSIPNQLKGSDSLDGSLVYRLTRMNDGDKGRDTKPRSFKQIANWIKKHL